MFSIETDAYLVGSDDEVRVEVLTNDLIRAFEHELVQHEKELRDEPHRHAMLKQTIETLFSLLYDCQICGEKDGH